MKSLKRCESIVVLGRDMIDYIEEIYPGSSDKIKYIPHWQDEDLIHPISLEDHPFIQENNLEEKFIVQYSGNMGLWNDMDSFGKSVNSDLNGVHYVFIGGGMREQELHESITAKNPENALFLPFQPTEKIGNVLSGCHASMVSLRNGLEGMAVPSKIYGILAAGIPVLALVPRKSEIAYIVEEEQCGIVIEPGDVSGLNEAILKLKSDEKLRTEMGKNSRSAFEYKYTIKRIAERYLQLLRNLE